MCQESQEVTSCQERHGGRGHKVSLKIEIEEGRFGLFCLYFRCLCSLEGVLGGGYIALIGYCEGGYTILGLVLNVVWD